MGVDYDPICGVGVEINFKIIHQLIANDHFTEEEWEDEADDCLSRLGIPYSKAGTTYSGGKTTMYSKVPGKTLQAVWDNAPAFIKKFADLGVELTLDDLIIIEDLNIW